MFAKFSSDNNHVAYVSQFNLYMENFETGEISKVMVSTEKLWIDNEVLPETVLTETLPANSTDPVVIALKLEYFTEINGHYYPLMSTASINSTVIRVDQG